MISSTYSGVYLATIFLYSLEALRVVGDVFLVVEVFVDQHVGEGVDQSHVGAVLQRQPLVGDAGGLDLAGIADDDLGALLLGLEDAAGDDRVTVGGVVAEAEDAVGVLDLTDRVGHGAVAEGHHQARDRGAVADAGAAVDVVGADDGAGELLGDVVRFVAGAARRPGQHDRIGAVFLLDLRQFAGGEGDRLVPGHGLEGGVARAADHRALQTRRQDLGVVDEVPAVPTLQAQFALVGDAVERLGADDLVVFDEERELAARSTIGADGNVLFHGSRPRVRGWGRLTRRPPFDASRAERSWRRARVSARRVSSMTWSASVGQTATQAGPAARSMQRSHLCASALTPSATTMPAKLRIAATADHLHRAEGAGDDAGLAAQALRLIHLDGRVAIGDRVRGAGVDAGGVLAMVTGHRRRDGERLQHFQTWVELPPRESLDVFLARVGQYASDFAGAATDALRCFGDDEAVHLDHSSSRSRRDPDRVGGIAVCRPSRTGRVGEGGADGPRRAGADAAGTEAEGRRGACGPRRRFAA